MNSTPVPGPSAEQLAQFVVDKEAALQLGKALFWDTRVGSDNKTACASCHFQAGADDRAKNQIGPGLLAGDTTFQLAATNTTLGAAHFPVPLATNDVVSSQGVFSTNFVSASTSAEPDNCERVADPVFHGGTLNTRRVEPRNTPTVINAVFNLRNFWDGRANNVFNGGDPFGMRNPNALVWKLQDGVLKQVYVDLPTSSLASQASGPPLSSFEMSCSNRAFVDLGRKLLQQIPLANQEIAPDDSVIAKVKQDTYAKLVAKAFNKDYWSATTNVSVSDAEKSKVKSMDLVPDVKPKKVKKGETASHMEANFALFFSLALQMYQSTLVSGDTPVDRYLSGTGTLTEQQLRGMEVFQGQGKCMACHGGAALTNASVATARNRRLELMPMANGEQAVYDVGYYNIGVRPTGEDLGVGGTDPFKNPLSETRMVQAGKANLLGDGFNAAQEPAVGPGQRVAVDGAFKTPSLRNVEFTGQYFHNGGKSTLMQVVDLYNRGGDFAAANRPDLAPDIVPLGLTTAQKEDPSPSCSR